MDSEALSFRGISERRENLLQGGKRHASFRECGMCKSSGGDQDCRDPQDAWGESNSNLVVVYQRRVLLEMAVRTGGRLPLPPRFREKGSE